MLQALREFFAPSRRVIQRLSQPVIEQEESPQACACGGTRFSIYDTGALYVCQSCEQRYVATLAEKFIKTNACPDCGAPLLEGPSGGCSINVRCEAHGHRFNLSFLMGIGVLVERN